MIEVKNLTKRYGRVLAVDDISFDVQQGNIVGFLGPNGAGKSTTLKIMTCYLPASTGTVKIDGFDVLTDSLEVRRRVGYMPESPGLLADMRVTEYLMFRAALRDIPRKNRKSAVDRVCQRCWLSHPQDMTRRRLGELSRGYKQRVAMAEVLLHEPPVLVLDEPTIGLDPAQIRAMRELINSLRGEHTVILSSHILAEVEQTCDHLVVIAGGKIAAKGTLEQLKKQVSKTIAEIQGDRDQILKDVKAIAGVRSVQCVEKGPWLEITIQGEKNTDHRQEIANLAASRRLAIRELKSGSLEDFFVENVGMTASRQEVGDA